MSKVKVIYVEKNSDKIIFSKKQLEEILDEVYNDGWSNGYDKGKASVGSVTINTPSTTDWWSKPYVTYSNATTDNCTIDDSQNSSGTVTVSNTAKTLKFNNSKDSILTNLGLT